MNMKEYKRGWDDALLWVLGEIEENPNAKLSYIGYIIEKDLDKKPTKMIDENSQSFFDFNQLKTFDRVLVRHGSHDVWHPAFFHSYKPEVRYSPFCTISSQGGYLYTQCVPYEGNEYLMGTIENAKPYYKF